MKKIDLISGLNKRELIELDACTRCRKCVEWCPIVSTTGKYDNTPMDKIKSYRSFIQNTHGLRGRLLGSRIDERKLEEFAYNLYDCTSCGRCGVVCPVGIHCQELWVDVRAIMRKLGYGPQDKVDVALHIMEKVHNPFDLPIEKRNEWIPEDLLVQEKADLAFFVGCELAYRAKPMAVGAVRLLQSSETPYTLLDDEWCCGFPLYILGERGMEFIGEVKNNVKKLREKGVKEVTTYCPCCLNVMKRGWPEVIEVPFKISHIFQILSEKIKAGRLKFTKSFDGKVTYHDPCYLSRGWKEGENIIEEPRRIINSIPGADLVEMEHNKKLSLCPGSGGGLRRINLPLSHKMSVPVLKEADATGAEVLLTACPAVYERLKMTVEEGIYAPKVEIMDLLQFASNHL